MSKLPDVAVVLPTYNAARTVGAALASIQCQTFAEFELIVVDDGSTDGSRQIVRDCAQRDRRIRLIELPSNRGVAAALNVGWRDTNARLIARMDADDVAHPERLCVQVEFLAEHPEIDVLGTGATLVDDQGRCIGRLRRPESHPEIVALLFRECPFIHPTVVMRRAFLNRARGYDEATGSGQDVDLWLRTFEWAGFHNLPDLLLTYTVPSSVNWRAAWEGSVVLWKHARRTGALLTKGRYAARHLLANACYSLGLRSPYRQ